MQKIRTAQTHDWQAGDGGKGGEASSRSATKWMLLLRG